MVYINSGDSNFKYLVEPHDNFLILSTKSHISGSSGDPDSVPALASYFNGYSFPFTYSSEQTFSFSNIADSFTSNFEDRSDFPVIFICGFILIFTLIFIINQLSKLVKKGGVFGFM